jgi:hypothetical protein
MPTQPSHKRREDDQKGIGSRVEGLGWKRIRREKFPPFLLPFIYSLSYTLDLIPDTLSSQSVKIAEAYVTALEVAASR